MAQDPETQSGEIPLVVSAELDADLVQEFLNDARDHLDHIEEGILVLEENATNHDVIHLIFRAFHTLKGNAGFLELTPICKLAHILESLLDQARDNRLQITSPIIEIILKGRDKLKELVDEVGDQITGKKPRTSVVIPTEELRSTIQKILDGSAPEKEEVPPAPVVPIEQPKPVQLTQADEPQLTSPTATEAPAEPSIPTSATTPAAKTAESAHQAVKVSTFKLDGLVDLAGELLIAQSLIMQNLSEATLCRSTLDRNLAHLNRVSKDLQRTAMSMRMVPIRSVFQKMHRLMRDTAARQKKDVQLILEGEDTEVDRTIVEKLSDPLMHMVRNAVDHAIEAPEQRKACGKPSIGTLLLRAYHKSGNIIIEVEDDGAGLNRERILEKAIRNGLVKPDAKPDDKELFSLIFAPGFSTAQVVTDISGRGVGMDVVQKNISKLRGKVDIRSVWGHGTTFTIRLPLTLAIIDGLLVRVGDERYILPAISVRESFHPNSCKIIDVPGRGELVQMRQELIPLLRLREHFRLPVSGTETAGIMIVIEADMNKRCLLVDELLGKQEVVIKNLGEVFQADPMISGGAILGDGCVGLILDAGALVNLGQSETSDLAVAA